MSGEDRKSQIKRNGRIFGTGPQPRGQPCLASSGYVKGKPLERAKQDLLNALFRQNVDIKNRK